jgi:hypothetical protein
VIYFGVKLVHVLAMALWVGGPVVAAFGARKRLAGGGSVAAATVEQLLAITPVFIGAALTTVLSGAALVYLSGGISHVAPRILVGAALVVPIFAVGGGMNRPALMGLRDHFAAGGDGASAERWIRRFVLAHNLEQALRVTVLVLMVLPI